MGDKVELLLIGPQTSLPVSVTADDLTLRKVCSNSLDGGLLKIKVKILRGRNSMIDLQSTEDEIVGGERLVTKKEEGTGNSKVDHSVSGHQHPGLFKQTLFHQFEGSISIDVLSLF